MTTATPDDAVAERRRRAFAATVSAAGDTWVVSASALSDDGTEAVIRFPRPDGMPATMRIPLTAVDALGDRLPAYVEGVRGEAIAATGPIRPPHR